MRNCCENYKLQFLSLCTLIFCCDDFFARINSTGFGNNVVWLTAINLPFRSLSTRLMSSGSISFKSIGNESFDITAMINSWTTTEDQYILSQWNHTVKPHTRVIFSGWNTCNDKFCRINSFRNWNWNFYFSISCCTFVEFYGNLQALLFCVFDTRQVVAENITCLKCNFYFVMPVSWTQFTCYFVRHRTYNNRMDTFHLYVTLAVIALKRFICSFY